MSDPHTGINDVDQAAQAELFKTCRHRLKMSVRDLQVELCFRDAQTVLKMESGEFNIHGTTWVAMMYLLDDNELEDLADRVQVFVDKLRDDLDAGRVEKWEKWQDKKKRLLAEKLLDPIE